MARESIDFTLFHVFGFVAQDTLIGDNTYTSFYYAAEVGETETVYTVSMPFYLSDDISRRDEYPRIDVYMDRSFTMTAVPIPSALWLFGCGLLGLAGIARRKKGV